MESSSRPPSSHSTSTKTSNEATKPNAEEVATNDNSVGNTAKNNAATAAADPANMGDNNNNDNESTASSSSEYEESGGAISMTQEMIAWDDEEDEVDLRRLIFRSPVPGKNNGRSPVPPGGSSTARSARSTGGKNTRSSSGGSGGRRLKKKRRSGNSSSKKKNGGSSEGKGSTTSPLPAKEIDGLFGLLFKGGEGGVSSPKGAAGSDGNTGANNARDDSSKQVGEEEESSASLANVQELPTQERSNVTENAANAASFANVQSNRPGLKVDENGSATGNSTVNVPAASTAAAAGSRRRLRRMNTHDGIDSSSSGNGRGGGGSGRTSTMRHPTAMKDIDDLSGVAIGDKGAAEAANRKRRCPKAGGAAAWLYGKENNRLDDRGNDGVAAKKAKKQQQTRQPFADSASSSRIEEVGDQIMEGIENEAEEDPFEDLLQEIEEDLIGKKKSPIPSQKRQQQQTSSSKSHGGEPSLSLSQPNPYSRSTTAAATSAPVSRPVLPARPSSAPTHLPARSSSTAPATTGINRHITASVPVHLAPPPSLGSQLNHPSNINPSNSGDRPSSAPSQKLSSGDTRSMGPNPSRASSSTHQPSVPHVPSSKPQKVTHATNAAVSSAAAQVGSKVTTVSSAPSLPLPVPVPSRLQKPITQVVSANVASTAAKIDSKPTMAPSNSGVDDLLGGIDFNDDIFAAMDTLVQSKQESQVTTVVAPPPNSNAITAMASAQDVSLPTVKTETSSATVQNAADEFGAFPNLDFNALDSAIGRRSLDTAASTMSTQQPYQQQQQQQQPSGDDANVKDEFGDFPELDFDAMDQLVQQKGNAPASGQGNAHPLQQHAYSLAMPSPHAPVRNPTASPNNAAAGPAFLSFARYKIVFVEEDLSTYTRTLRVAHWTSSKMSEDTDDADPAAPSTKIISPDKIDGSIHLRGEWYHTESEPGDTVHLCSLSGRYQTGPSALPVVLHTAPPQGSDLDDDLVLIVHPDTLLTPTAISETVTCIRRAVLKMRLGSSGLSSEAAIFGTMRHDLFERCMQERNFSSEFAQQSVDQIVRSHSDTLVGCQIYDDKRARNEVLRVLPQIRDFAAKYCAFGPKPAQMTLPGVNKSSRLQGHGFQTDIDFTADAVYATEEAAISPELGLKGFVDATLATSTSPCSQPQPYGGGQNARNPPLRSLMGVELKTGHRQNPQNEHMAQLALYTLMLRMRRGSAVLGGGSSGNNNDARSGQLTESAQRHLSLQNGAATGGMLLYLNHESFLALHVSPILSEVKSLIGQRNVLAIDARKAMKPRGVVLSYDDEKNGGRDSPASSSGKASTITILPAPPAQLPELVSPSSCTRCYSNRECMMYAASDIANAPAIQRTHGQLMSHYTGHLGGGEMQYFLDWDRMVDLESRAGRHDIAKAWLKSSQERERSTGKTFSDLVFATSYQLGQEQTPKNVCSTSTAGGDKVILRFDRAPESAMPSPLNSLKIEDRSHIVLSTDGISLRPSEKGNGTKAFRHQMNVFRGIVEKVSDTSVSVLASKNDLRQVQDLISLWQECTTSTGKSNDGALRFRLDKDDIATGTGTLRQNLIKLFTADVASYKPKRKQDNSNNTQVQGDVDSRLLRRMPWLRRAIIQMDPPQFDATLTNSMFNQSCYKGAPKVKGCQFDQLSSQYSTLNVDQRHAVDKVISAKDYAIIQGLPGTGKTSTIAFVARLLAAQGKRLLITSYTHAAVDNLLMKLMESGVHGNEQLANASDLIRIGTKSSCHVDIHPILAHQVALDRESNINSDKPSAGALYQIVSAARVIGCTALTVPRTPLLAKQHFDVVIVDEAGQISQPAILGALMAADSFVLVGDHMQLPPLVADNAAEQAGYGVSMLKRLAEKHSDAVAKLTLQYRMHENICSLCNDIVYKGELKCANDEVRTSKLILSRYPKAVPVPIQQDSAPNNSGGSSSSTNNEKGWLQRVLNPDIPAVFVDTDAIGSSDSGAFQGLERSSGRRQGGTIVNDTEVVLVRSIVRCLLKCGLNSASIGVICPYRSQLRLLDDDRFLRRMKKTGLEISTIDRYQGRDKGAIVLSLVRSNSEGKSGRLLEDFRRLNVAISRAKRKLIIIGSMKTLTKGSDVLRPVLHSMQKRGWVEKLPTNAIQMYESPTPLSMSQATY